MKADASKELLKPDLCIIGAGSGGLTVAAGAAQMGAKVVLIEKGEMGGDCLNYGCVPSKAIIAAAKKAHAMRSSAKFGIAAHEPDTDYGAVMDHVRHVIDEIAPIDSQERFEGLGVHVIRAPGKFTAPRLVEAGSYKIRARRFVVATGSAAFVPPLPGLESVPYLTNETLFENRVQPEHLIILGGGPIGMEMAQAHRRLGSKVTVVEMGKALAKDDPDLTAIVLSALRSEGVDIREGTKATAVSYDGARIVLQVEHEGHSGIIEGSHLLVAAGRAATVDGLGLEEAGIDFDRRGIKVDARLRTSEKKVFAIGDVAGGLQFTHVAGYHGGIVIRNALFHVPAKADHSAIPWTTYTDPELAHVGLSAADATKKGIKHQVLTWSFEENDRAQADLRTEGLIKVVVQPGGRILGATIAGPSAGELIQPWVLALSQKMKIGAFTGMVAPYPTLGEVSKRAAGAFYSPTLFSKRTRLIVRLLSQFG